jgi:hypothetical protein
MPKISAIIDQLNEFKTKATSEGKDVEAITTYLEKAKVMNEQIVHEIAGV